MLKIAIGCNFYNQAKELERLLNSIPPNTIDYFIGIDGIYRYLWEKHQELPPISEDNHEILLHDNSQKFNSTVLICYKPYTTEFEKRNTYLEICEKFKKDINVLIIVDCDEYFVYPEGSDPVDCWRRFKRNIETAVKKTYDGGHNVFGIHTHNVHDGNYTDSYKPRIWYNPGEMRYIYGSHYHYANVKREQVTIESFKNNRICYCQPCIEVIKGVVLAHDHSLRSQEYKKLHEDYIEYLRRFEGLVQSHKYNIDEAHKLASKGISYEDTLKNK